VNHLDTYLSGVNGEKDDFFKQFNKIDTLNHVVVAYKNEQAIACGAIKPYDDNCMEIKRMYVLPEQRGFGVASALLAELEKWALELNYQKCILETSIKMSDAVGLYQKNNYRIIDNYGQYVESDDSICMEKTLSLC
jgi:GNAT superfamily N-acetyltransferase